MIRGLCAGACVLALAVGCETTTTSKYTPPPEQIPPPATVEGATVVIEDQRPDWERQPFGGNVSLFHLARVKPSPWVQLEQETEAVVAALPQKPERVTVTVTSFRLVKKDDAAMKAQRDAIGKMASARDPSTDSPGSPGMMATGASTTGIIPNSPSSANPNGNPSTVTQALGSNPMSALGSMMSGTRPQARYAGALGEHPPGASCSVSAVVQLTYPGGETKQVTVQSLGAGPNVSGTAYWGEALDQATRLTVINYGRKLREGVGLPAD